MLRQIAWPIINQSQAAEARRMAVEMAKNLGFDETVTGKVAIVATEAARNLVKHAGRGELIIRHLEVESMKGIEIMTLDRGPGMANVSQCMADGYSTSGSPGIGLGSICRLSSLFDIYSEQGTGTALVAQIWAKPLPKGHPLSGIETGAICLSKPGEDVSGDSWAQVCQPGKCLFLVTDGLGHGPLAAEASLTAQRVFRANTRLDPGRILEAIHAALWSTRGAAVVVSRLNLARRIVVFTGVGNISSQIITAEKTTHLASYNGTAGGEISRIRQLTYPWPEGAVLIMHSDGLAAHWKLSQHPGLIRKHPSLIAGILYRDYTRGTDDVTVLAVKESGQWSAKRVINGQ
ncbi:MAG: ATP-binding SpoIIE family protein phosphatase [bacterium]